MHNRVAMKKKTETGNVGLLLWIVCHNIGLCGDLMNT